MTKSVLLTGGFGNIGGRFSAFLTRSTDHQLTLSSRQTRPAPTWASCARVVTCDLTEPTSLDAATSGIETIYHFASINDRDCANDPQLAYAVNVDGTRNLVRSAIHSGVRRIVYMSTIHVYGSPLTGNITESSPTSPSHPYGKTHLAAEDVLRTHSAEIDSVIVRCGNGFGFPMSADVDIWHILVNDLCTQAIQSSSLTLKSPSNIERNFVTLSDICRGLLHLDNDALDLGPCTTFNLGSLKSRSLRTMADLVATCYAKKFQVEIEVIESVPQASLGTALNFDSSQLRQTGFTTIEDFDTEIDGILDVARLRNAS